ncbi:MAG: SDR family oxidoreductase [Candidatus Promineifilaceae bacterium]|nr:SDR family oxidoreductase [Candidatus Promineifilaceae bacterium]
MKTSAITDVQASTNETSAPVLVTGATGNVGKEVVKALHALGQAVRATALNSENAAHVPAEADETVFFEFGKPETFPQAFDGVKKLFLMRPPAISDVETYIKPVIEYAADNGVEQIAFLSLMGIEKKTYVPHYKVERYIEASGVPYTFLRPGFFMQNLDTTHRVDIVEHNDLFIPAGKAKTAFIDVRDIGAVAAHVLATPGHKNKAYELTGSESLTYYQVAEIFTAVLGRKINYSNPSILRFMWRMKKRGYTWGYVVVTAGLYLSTRRGSAERISDDIQRLLGREPIKMRQYVEDYAPAWQI